MLKKLKNLVFFINQLLIFKESIELWCNKCASCESWTKYLEPIRQTERYFISINKLDLSWNERESDVK